jgi:hypothetical protein
MGSHDTTRSRVVVGVVLVIIGAVVYSTWGGGGFEVALFGAAVAYSLVMVGLALGTVRLFRSASHRTRVAMGAALAAFAVLGLVGAATSTDGRAVVFIVQMVIGAAIIDVVVLATRRRRATP